MTDSKRYSKYAAAANGALMPLNPGDLRHRVQVQRPSETRSPLTGERTKSWTTDALRWAKIEPISGREFFEAQQQQNVTTHRVTIRKYASLTTEWRFVRNGRAYNIEFIQRPEEVDEMVVCLCREEAV